MCAIVGLCAFTEHWRGVQRLPSVWGGEAIYHHASAETQALLSTLGVPSVVVLDLSLSAAEWNIWPGLGRTLAGHLARLPFRGADVVYRASIPASAVRAVWQPGSPEYDRFPDLPRA